MQTHPLYDDDSKAYAPGVLQYNSLIFGVLIYIQLLDKQSKLRGQAVCSQRLKIM